MQKKLPQLAKLILPALLTKARGVKVPPAGVSVSATYGAVTISKKALAKYVKLLDWSQSAPFPYLYVLAQRAQTALMLDKAFTIALPGLVHLRNELQQLAPCDYTEAFTLKARSSVPYKVEGSLIITSTVDFWQDERKVAECTSVYLAKRKSKSLQSRPKLTDRTTITDPVYTEVWDIPKLLGKQYARASGDINPIHTSAIIARAMGFPRCILHGWYAASRAVRTFETFRGWPCTSIVVDFKAPVFLPSQQELQLEGTAEEIRFQLRDMATGKVTVTGTL